MFIKILFNYRGERTQGKCVIRANRPDTGQDSHPPFPKLQEKKCIVSSIYYFQFN
jgi:hypothetical protein